MAKYDRDGRPSHELHRDTEQQGLREEEFVKAGAQGGHENGCQDAQAPTTEKHLHVVVSHDHIFRLEKPPQPKKSFAIGARATLYWGPYGTFRARIYSMKMDTEPSHEMSDSDLSCSKFAL